MSRKRKAKLRRVAGGDRRSHSNKPLSWASRRTLDSWWLKHSDERPFAATATRKLRFAQIHRLLNDQPPTRVCREDQMRIYLFRSGEDRDRFVEEFHYEFKARALTLGAYDASQEA